MDARTFILHHIVTILPKNPHPKHPQIHRRILSAFSSRLMKAAGSFPHHEEVRQSNRH